MFLTCGPVYQKDSRLTLLALSSIVRLMPKEIAWLLREKYHGEKSPAFFADCARLEVGEPLAYIIGSIPFLNCLIYLDSKPLIPRPETEFWTEKAITTMQGQSLTVLDLCAGSGAIGVAVAKAIPTAQITFAEIDSAHLPIIRKNIEVNLPQTDQKTHTVVQSDLFTNVSGTFDYILTNPPYIDIAAGTVDPSVERHEPHLALFGGVDGMEVIVKILQQAKDRLTPAGELWIEHEPFQAGALTPLAAVHGYDCTNHVDQYGTVRYSILTKAVAK